MYLGKYPQTKVDDAALIELLTKTAGTLPTSEDTKSWTDYGYYCDGEIDSYMYYIDIDQDNDGSNDYRGVYFTEYRPYWTTETDEETYQQENNGYSTNTIYWFKYESIKWNILTKTDDNKTLILTTSILDSQDYNYTNDDRSDVNDYQGNKATSTVYASNYMYSHIRSWLNTSFYETAFSKDEQNKILTTTVDNSASSTKDSSNIYACEDTKDKMFLLSYKEVTTYCSSTSRQAQGSDYAKSQGLFVSTSSSYNDNSYYWLRSPHCYGSYGADYVCTDGYVSRHYYGVGHTDSGVRAACWINL